MEVIYKATQEEIYQFLLKMDGTFRPPLSSRVDLNEYSHKLFEKGNIIAFQNNNEIISAIFYYLNAETKEAYIPVLGTLSEYEGKGFFRSSISKLEFTLRLKGIKTLGLETWQGNKALNYYIKLGFFIKKRVKDRSDNFSIHLKKNISKSFAHLPFTETPIETNTQFNRDHNINLFIKRDDLFPIIGGGSKARKLKYILKAALDSGCTGVVTAGSNPSNHLRATAILCRELSLKFYACIHDIMPPVEEIKGNLKFTTELADKCIFTAKENISEVMDEAVSKMISNGENPFYIWGGGHSLEGTYAYYQATLHVLEEMKENLPDHIFVASGTGTTQAGITLAVNEKYPNCKVIGISIARSYERGKKAVEEAYIELKEYLNLHVKTNPMINFDAEYLMGGYGVMEGKGKSILKKYIDSYGLLLDPCYSGKAFYAMIDYLKKGQIKNETNILFWNTGGYLNLFN